MPCKFWKLIYLWSWHQNVKLSCWYLPSLTGLCVCVSTTSGLYMARISAVNKPCKPLSVHSLRNVAWAPLNQSRLRSPSVRPHREQTHFSVVDVRRINKWIVMHVISFLFSHFALSIFVTASVSGTQSFSPTHMHTQQEHLPMAATHLRCKRLSASGHEGIADLWSLLERHPARLTQQIWFKYWLTNEHLK